MSENLLKIALVALAMAFVGYLQFRRRFVQYLFFLRVPLAYGLILFVVLPLALRTQAFNPLFTLETVPQLAVVAFMVAVSTWIVIYTGSLIFVGAAQRFSLRFREPDLGEEAGWDVNPVGNRLPALFEPHRLRAQIVALGLSAPILYFSFTRTPLDVTDKLLGIAGGLAVAFLLREGLRRAANYLRDWLRHPSASQPASRFWKIKERLRLAAYRFRETILGRAFTLRGYTNLVSDAQETARIPVEEREAPVSHLRELSLIALATIVYLLGAVVLDPSNTEPWMKAIARHTPALAYVLLVVTLFAMVLSAVTFFLDFYRVPLLLFLGSLLFYSYMSSDLDHYYQLLNRTPAESSASSGDPITASQVLAAWHERRPPATHPVMVVMAVSGGGGHSARWTTEVLARLREEPRLGQRFFESITFVSAVSGGSLGTLYALDRYRPEGVPDSEALNAAKRAADKSHVGALAWGMTYPDLARKVLPRLFDTAGWRLFDAQRDRGWALEQSWRSGLSDSSRVATLASWADEARRAIRPAVAFNATLVETGGRFVLSHVSIPATGAQEFTVHYPHYDLPLSTAVRLSATFPYLSPIARPLLPMNSTRSVTPEEAKKKEEDEEKKNDAFKKVAFHLADGGYYESSGVLTAIDFVRAVIDQYRSSGRRKIVLLRILSARESGQAADDQGWLSSLAGPPLTALKAFQSTQSGRSDLELGLLVDRWNNADLAAGTGVEIQPIIFRLPESGTLPWHLTRNEIDTISGAWSENRNPEELEKLVRFFTDHQK